MKSCKYYLGSGDYFGTTENNPNIKFENGLLPYLKSLKLDENEINNIFKYVQDLYELGYSNGADNANMENSEY